MSSDKNRKEQDKKIKLPARAWILSAFSFLSLVFSALFARIVTFPATNAKRSTLFIYQTLSTTLSWGFVLAAGAALATFLVTAHEREVRKAETEAQRSDLSEKEGA